MVLVTASIQQVDAMILIDRCDGAGAVHAQRTTSASAAAAADCGSPWLEVKRTASRPIIAWSCGIRIEHCGMLVAADIAILTAKRIRCLRTNGCENKAIYPSYGGLPGTVHRTWASLLANSNGWH